MTLKNSVMQKGEPAKGIQSSTNPTAREKEILPEVSAKPTETTMTLSSEKTRKNQKAKMQGKNRARANISHYDLEFLHPNRASLGKLIKSFPKGGSPSFSFQDTPRKVRGKNLFYVKAIVSFEETAYDTLSDKLSELLDKITFLEVGGSFIDNHGRGYVNSCGDKDYTKFFNK